MIETNHPALTIKKQAELLELNRTGIYYTPRIVDDSEIANQIHEMYMKSRCRYGYRKIVVALADLKIIVNHKKVQRLMKDMGIRGLYPARRVNTTIANNNQKFPSLLKGLIIVRPNQVWATDISVPCKAA